MKFAGYIIVAGFLVLLVAILIYQGGDKSASVTEFVRATSSGEVAEMQPSQDGTKEYVNANFHFSLSYPVDLIVSEFREKGGALTIIFQNTKTASGFQIFIQPYFEAQVSNDRFLRDVPSGVRENLENVSIDRIPGTAFDSKDLQLGDTREVWFIRNQRLFEVTALRKDSAWLSGILKTWHFE